MPPVPGALGAVGPEFETILLDTCCFLNGIEESESRYGWPRRSAKLVLKLALSALARHYEGGGRKNRSRTMAWMVEGPRPVISPAGRAVSLNGAP